jgi:hypothetical protein
MQSVHACLTILAASCLPALGAVFQFAAPVTTASDPSTALLWIPPHVPAVRGVVLAGATLMEGEFVKDPHLRQTCADQALALVYLKCGLGAADLPKVLADLAGLSGYREIATAPVFFVGHSAGGPHAKAAALKFREKCFGLIQYRGGGPWDGEPLPAGVPALMMVGQFDEFVGPPRDATGREPWERILGLFQAFRAENPARTVTLVVEPGAGHFALSERNGRYAALFLRKAAQAIGRRLDPADGWLTDSNLKSPTAQLGAVAEFSGDKATANWHFDHEMAAATVAYHAGLTGQRDQFLKWNHAHWVDAGARYFFHEIHWVGDGQTFEVAPVYADKVPPPWAGAGEPVGHSPAPIIVRPVHGPVVAIGPQQFRFQYDNVAGVGDGLRVTFLAASDGDAQYRYTELVGMLPRGFRGLTDGQDQTLTFPALAHRPAAGPPTPLHATSTAGLPVEYYVAHGPARIDDGGQLVITEVPARARFPLEVKVVAYQFGRALEPKVKTAAPVTQTFRIESP